MEISLKPQTPLSSSCDVINSSNDRGITVRKPSRIDVILKKELKTLFMNAWRFGTKVWVEFKVSVVNVSKKHYTTKKLRKLSYLLTQEWGFKIGRQIHRDISIFHSILRSLSNHKLLWFANAFEIESKYHRKPVVLF